MRTVMGLAVAGAVAVAWSPVANAAVASEDLAVGAAVTAKCTISTSAIAFDPYDPIGTHAATPLDGDGSVTITCTKNKTATISLGAGLNADGTTRNMSDGTNDLVYELYSDAGRLTVWNDGGGVFNPGAAPSKAPRSFPVYGRVPANQDVPAGDYEDTVVATVNF
jgi:spore coat protein U-like protein